MTYDIPSTDRIPTTEGYDLVSRASGISMSVMDVAGDLSFEVTSDQFDGSPHFAEEMDDWNAACRAFAELWLRWVTAEIGMGFHPDTSAELYTPGLPEPLMSEYDEMIGFAFQYVEDPYEIGLDAMKKLGFMDLQPVAP